MPALPLRGELAATLGRQRVKPRLAVLVSHSPFRFDPTLLLHAVQRRVQRAFLDAQQLIGTALDVRGDRVAVHRLPRGQRAEDQQGQCALQHVVLARAHETKLAIPS